MPSSRSPYFLVEPHPSVSQSSHPAIHTARGGAGNVFNLRHTQTTPPQSATGPASAASLGSRRHSGPFKSSRGGAGNTHFSGERAIFSFDEELERDLRRAAPVYHIGRGGKGNSVCRSSFGSSESSKSSYFESDRASADSQDYASDLYYLSRKLSGRSSTTSTNSSAGSDGDRTRDHALWRLERTWGKIKGLA